MVFFVFLTPGENHALVEMDPKSILAHILPAHGINLSLPIFLLYASQHSRAHMPAVDCTAGPILASSAFR